MTDPALYSRDEQIRDVSSQRPHLVILGAGASVAACPSGDRNGKKLPVMLNLVETVGLTTEFDRAGIAHQGKNFELVYAQIANDSRLSTLRVELENRIAEYFRQLKYDVRRQLEAAPSTLKQTPLLKAA